MITTPSGLNYLDTLEGAGPSPQTGQTCSMHYTGWLSDGGKPGSKFDSSVDRGQPFSFTLGVGARGAGGVIPPQADLIFEVELLDFR